MQMYNVITLPLAEEDIQSNTDYIAFEKQAPDTALQLTVEFRKKITRSEAMEAFEDCAGRRQMFPKCLWKKSIRRSLMRGPRR